MTSPHDGRHGTTRRGFLLGAATGLAVAAGVPAAWRGARHVLPLLRDGGASPFGGPAREERRPDYAMPGPYPGRVVEVHHPGAVAPDHRVSAAAVERMVDRGMAELTGNDDPRDVKGSWGRLFQKGDVVGIKVNPVGRKPTPGEEGRVANAVGAISSPEVLVKVIRCLRAVGIPDRDVVVFERYADEFREAGYADLLR